MGFLNQFSNKQKHAKKTVPFTTLWEDVLSSYILKDKSIEGTLRPEYNAYNDMIGLYSQGDYVTFIYTIDGYPSELELSYFTSIRSQCRGDVKVSFINTLEKTIIDWNSSQMKARMRTWRTVEEEQGPVDEYNLYQNLSSMDNMEWKKDSLVYLSTAEIRRKRKLYKSRTLMLISGTRGVDFDQSTKDIVGICHSMNLKVSRVLNDIPAYLKMFSPFSNVLDMKVQEQVGAITVPDEIIARFNSYSQGIIGVKGIYWGTDIFSNFPCLKQVKRTTETAENWLITAETGGGKSFFVKGLIIQLLANPLFNGTIMDVEGFEYIPMLNYMSHQDDVVLLNMAEGTGMYYDPVAIKLTGNEELDADMYALSSAFTLSLFKCLLGTTQEEDEWIDIVINDAVSLTYAKHGVDPLEKDTWELSADLTLYDVYDTLKSLRTQGDASRAINSMYATSLYQQKIGAEKQSLSKNDVNRLITSNEGYQQAIEMCIAKISRYFEPNGIRASLFRERIEIDEVRDAKLVLCSFGMAGKSQNTVDPIQMALMQLYAANISHLRSIFSKNAGKFNFKLWEEFQRWGGFPDADKTINVALTGGRKLGDVNIIVTNKVIEMLQNVRFGVFSNLTSIAVGAIGDAAVREELCERLSIMEMLPALNALAENNKNLGDYIKGDTLLSNPYSKGFLIGLDRTVYTLARMSIPKDLAQSLIFRTGIDLKTEDSEKE